jgi:D-beta-D-heptose 7-phosphate kinase/D-beta-D-heptose 1-phosphate adenosyltransferase
MPGGAANVARNLASLGLVPVLAGVIGEDEAGEALKRILLADCAVEAALVVVSGRRTAVKTRLVAGGQQLLRLDDETRDPIDTAAEQALLGALEDSAQGSAAIILSDYGKGALTDKILARAVALGQRLGVPVIADPKGADFIRYGPVDILKPNAGEFAAALGRPATSDAEIEAGLAEALKLWPARAIVVTRAARGMSLATGGQPVRHLSGQAREVFDVSGAGDTSLAALTAAVVGGADFETAVACAIIASGIAVGKSGTAAVSADEVLLALDRPESAAEAPVMSRADLAAQVRAWRMSGLRLGFTNGCFDILHAGHLSLLEAARQGCDRLVVGVNSDASVRRLKGPSRPVNPEGVRARLLSALKSVAAVTVFDEDTPLELIRAIEPDLLVKGGDYARDQIVGADLVEAAGGQVMIVPLVEGFSTTRILARSRSDPA